ncbi:unnamed protein product [Moneuplotes crassus]|uniref:Uncharacterized protein n=3 Tax=Euplotes crassus TaxID=5936 RepID=A0AAD1UI09_EUPCR|nr:unnamed protein product [Moneuplotes crassus]
MSQALKNIFLNYIPSALTMYIEYSVTFLNVLFISLLDDPVLVSGCGLGLFLVTNVIFTWNVGLCGGIDTLVSQAFGRKDYKLCGTYLNTSKILFCILAIPQALILFKSRSILALFGQPEDASIVAQKYASVVMFGMFLNMQFEATRRFLIAQGIFRPVLYTLTFTTIFHIIGLYITVLHLGWEINGVGLVTVCTFILNYSIILVYVNIKQKRVLSNEWFFMDKEALRAIPEFLKYGIPAALMMMIEVLGYDMQTIFAGWLGSSQQAANIIMFQIWILIFMNSLGVTYCSTSLVGNSLGGNKPEAAKTYSEATFIFGFSTTFVLALIYYIFRHAIIGAFTSNQEVTYHIMDCFSLYLIALFSDCGQGFGQGIIRAAGYQKLASCVQLVSLWAVLVPLAYVLAFVFDFGFKGIWIATPISATMLMIGYIGIIFCIPWTKLAEEVSKKRSTDSNDSEGESAQSLL